MSKLSDRIIDAETDLTKLKDDLCEATKSLEAAPDEESLLHEVEELTDRVEKSTATLNALKKAEKVLAQRAEAETKAPAIAPDLAKHNKAKPTDDGSLIFKHATAKFLSHIERKTVDQVIEERYRETPQVKETFDYIRKSQVDPAMTTTSGWAAELVQTDVRGFLQSLEDISVAARLATYATSVDFGGFQSVTVPMEDNLAATPSEPAWIAEGSPIPLAQFGYSSMTLQRYKLAAIATFTKEIADRSTPQIETLLRNSLRKQYAKVLDQALLANAAAIASVRPAGLISGVSVTSPTAGGGDAAVRGDILALLTAMTASQLGTTPVLIMNNMDRLAASMMVSSLSEYLFKDELAAGTLLSIPVIYSGHVPQHTLLLVDASAIATAFDTPLFDVSDVASVVESNADATPPTMASDAAGAASSPTSGIVPVDGGIPINEAGRPLGVADAGFKARSLWQTYSVGIRMIAPTSWGVLRTGAVEYMSATTWT